MVVGIKLEEASRENPVIKFISLFASTIVVATEL
jgi:hypothetical protein